jgi:hypothetical protein
MKKKLFAIALLIVAFPTFGQQAKPPHKTDKTPQPKAAQMRAKATALGIALTWVASTTVAGTGQTITYNLFRGTTSGGESYTTPINSTAIAGVTYTDNAVTSGQYCYTAEAVLTAGTLVENSVPSAEVCAAIPAPPAAPTGLTTTVQ